MAASPTPEPNAERAKSDDGLRWTAFFQRSQIPIFLLNRRQQLVFVNRAWEALTGLPLGRVRGSLRRRREQRARPFEALKPLMRVLRPPREVLDGQTARIRRLSPRGQVSRGWWEIAFFPLGGGDQLHGVLGTIQLAPLPGAGPASPLPEKLVNLRLQRCHEYRLDHLHSELPAMQRVVEQVRLASQSSVPVLLVGEPGTGKQWVARTVHQLSEQREAPFVALDCSRLPALALEDVLLGEHQPAQRRGVVYLKEPASLSRDLQDQLCQWLSHGEEAEPNRWRVMAGCSVDPALELRAGRLREDLYCQLSLLTIALPPLRERLADLPFLTEQILRRLHGDTDRRITAVAPDALDLLHNHAWPGNLRELHAVLSAASRRARGDRIGLADLAAYLRPSVPVPERALPLKTLLAQVERRLIELALRQTKQNKSRAAELLAIWRPLLLRRMKALGIEEQA